MFNIKSKNGELRCGTMEMIYADAVMFNASKFDTDNYAKHLCNVFIKNHNNEFLNKAKTTILKRYSKKLKQELAIFKNDLKWIVKDRFFNN